MKSVIVLVAMAAVWAGAATRYVALDGGHVPPFESWAAAATNIQAAVDASSDGDTILVTNGVYRTGGQFYGAPEITNRVMVSGAITVRSVNGAAGTIIAGQAGAGGGCGTGAVRCVYVRNGARVSGFTLSNGYTSVQGADVQVRGGGAYVYRGQIDNCIITKCVAENYGGGAALDGAVMRDSVVQRTSVNKYGGNGIYASTGSLVSNCVVRSTLAANISALSLNLSTGVACRAEYNPGVGIAGYKAHLVECRSACNLGCGLYVMDSCLVQRSVSIGNKSGEPGAGLFARGSRIENCIIAGNRCTNNGGGVYLEIYTNIMINCTIVGNHSDALGGGVYCARDTSNVNNIIMYNTAGSASSSNYYSVASGFHVVRNCIVAPTPAGTGNYAVDPQFADAGCHDYRLRESSPCIDGGLTALAPQPEDIAGVQRVIGTAVDVGAHEFVPRLAAASPLHYADAAGGNQWPYTNSAAAAHTLQAALDAAESGDRVLLAPGIYGQNYASYRGLKSRGVAMRAVSIEALASNTPAATVLLGEPDIGGGTGTNGFAMRGLAITAGVSVTGVTISNGWTRDTGTPIVYLRSGGGVLCDNGGIVNRCMITGNMGQNYGGGVMLQREALVTDCVIHGNRSHLGAGAYMGGGGMMRNTLVTDNYASQDGAGLYLDMGGSFESCTIADNSAAASAGGVYLFSTAATSINNVIYYNTAASHSNLYLLGRVGYTCVHPLPDSGLDVGGCISNAPWFADRGAGDYRMAPGSPTIDAGTNQAWMAGATDLEGNPRIYDGIVDMGCYELVPEPGWLGLLGLFTIYKL